MLTKDLSIFEYKNRERVPDRLTTKTHLDYPERIAHAIAIYTSGAGKRRHDLHLSVEKLFEDDPNYNEKRIAGFCRLLDKESKFDKGSGSAKLRTTVFGLAAEKYPLVREPGGLFGSSRSEMTVAIERKLKRPWVEVEDSLFDDIENFQRQLSFNCSLSPRDFLAAYNLAQVQACLYEAHQVIIETHDNLKEILRYSKLAGLMHSIIRKPEGHYVFELSGPASVHRHTQIYGFRIARMIPGLLACSNWRLTAHFNHRGWKSTFQLCPKSGLRSPVLPVAEYDSSFEAEFAAKWGEGEREGWYLLRETEILHSGQRVFVPDFQLKHTDGRRVHLEIVGFWTPEYIKSKRETLAAFREHPILIAVADSKTSDFSDLNIPVAKFAKKLLPSAVLKELPSLF